MVPTPAVRTQTGVNGTIVTECSSPPLGDGYSNIQLLAFSYDMHLPLAPSAVLARAGSPDQRVHDAAAVMERRIHEGLAERFLECDNGDDVADPDDAVLAGSSSFRITAVMSAPADAVDPTSACDASDEPPTDVPTECWVVVAQLSMDAFFPSPGRRFLQFTSADPRVLDSVGDYLNNSMANDDFIRVAQEDDGANALPAEDRVVQVSFRGFLNVLEGNDDSTSSSSGVNNAEGIVGRTTPVGDDSILFGSAAIGGAALLLLIVALLAVSKNRNRQEAYLRQLDDLDDLDSDGSSQPSHVLGDGRVHLVREEDYDRFEAEEVAIEMELPATHNDVHFCSSATCPICRHRVLGPTFVSTSLTDADTKDLSPRRRPILPNGRHYEAPDTVHL